MIRKVRYTIKHEITTDDFDVINLSPPSNDVRETRSLKRTASNMRDKMQERTGQTYEVQPVYYGFAIWRSGEEVQLRIEGK